MEDLQINQQAVG